MATAASRRGGLNSCSNREQPTEGGIPKSSDPTQATIVISKSRSLYSPEHLRIRTQAASVPPFYKSDTRRKPAKTAPNWPRCQIKVVGRLKKCRRNFQKGAPPPSALWLVHPFVRTSVFESLTSDRRLAYRPTRRKRRRGESGIIVLFKKHLWVSARLSRRGATASQSLCTFLSTLPLSLPVCGLDTGVRREALCFRGRGWDVLRVVSYFCFYLLYYSVPFLISCFLFSLHCLL